MNQKEILEDTGKSMIIRRLLTEHEEELSAFRGNIRKRGFVDEVKSMLSELLQYGVTPEMLKKRSMEMGTESVLYAKLQDITVIYEAFLEKIHEKYMTTEEVPDRLCDVIEQSAVIRNVTVYLDDFTGFTPIQYRLMTRILQLAPESGDDIECGLRCESLSGFFCGAFILSAEGYDLSTGTDLS